MTKCKENQKDNPLTPGKVKMFFARKSGSQEITTINDVTSGKSCGCECLGCTETIIAKKGSKYRHHFSHSVNCNCSYSTKSALIEYAKHLILNKLGRGYFRLPLMKNQSLKRNKDKYIKLDYSVADELKGKSDIKHGMASQSLEVNVTDAKVTDAKINRYHNTSELTQGKLRIEFTIKESLNDDRVESLLNAGIPCVNIDLSDIYDSLRLLEKKEGDLSNNIKALEDLVFINVDRKSWIVNSSKIKEEKEFHDWVFKKDNNGEITLGSFNEFLDKFVGH